MTKTGLRYFFTVDTTKNAHCAIPVCALDKINMPGFLISEHKTVQYNGSAVSADAGELWVCLVGSMVLRLEGRSLTR